MKASVTDRYRRETSAREFATLNLKAEKVLVAAVRVTPFHNMPAARHHFASACAQRKVVDSVFSGRRPALTGA